MDSCTSIVLIICNFILSFRWYFGKIKRLEAEKKLLLGQNEHGSFLIRDSESRRNDFSLSVRDGDTVKHYRIRWVLGLAGWRTEAKLYQP